MSNFSSTVNSMEEVRERKQGKKNAGTILVKTCTEATSVNTYKGLQSLIEDHYPNYEFTFKQEFYPLPVWKNALYRLSLAVFSLLMLIVVAILVIPRTKYAYLISQEFIQFYRQNKLVIMVIAFIFNYLSEYFQQTGAFEVYFNGELVSSKLKDGDYPEEETIFSFIDNKL